MHQKAESAEDPREGRWNEDPVAPTIRVSMVSLGCAKNLVDSEMILGRLTDDGIAITPQPQDADVIVVNTCGFIQSAKEESIQTILEMCEIKKRSRGRKRVLVAGCLSQRYGEELRKEVPEIDAIVGVGEYDDIGETIRSLARARRRTKVLRVGDPTRACNAEVGRFRLTPRHYAYLRISEGCDNPCTFCAIPAIRGRFRSKPIAAIVEEAHELAAGGTKEIVLISQDTTSYGVDVDGRFELPRLLESLCAVEGVEWIRVLYVYPSFVTDPMIDAIAGLDKVLKYIDIPLQHISDTMLRRMGRRSNESKTRTLLEKLRARIPGLYLRTTFLVGFPGEDEKEFATLRDFVRDFRFERLGVFTYSQEEGTPAATFPDPVPRVAKERRAAEIMLLQQENAFRHNRSREGEVVRVIVDEVDGGESDAGKREAPARMRGARARSYGEAPEIDPSILIRAGRRASTVVAAGSVLADPRTIPLTSSGPATSSGPGLPAGFREIPVPALAVPSFAPGDFIEVRITGSKQYDLIAEL